VAIDIGYDAINRSSTSNPGNTVVLRGGQAATASGVIETIKIYPYNNLSYLRVGAFSISGYTCTCRDYAYIGSVSGGAQRTYSGLSIDVVVGDFIGLYWEAGYVDAVYGSWGSFYKAGNQMEAGAQVFAVLNHIISLEGYIVGPSATSWGGIIG
jgi:hypothetical protein